MLLRNLFSEFREKHNDFIDAALVAIAIAFVISLVASVVGLLWTNHWERDATGAIVTVNVPYPTEAVLCAIVVIFTCAFVIVPSFFEGVSRKQFGRLFYVPLLMIYIVIFSLVGFQSFTGLDLLTYIIMAAGSIAVAEIIFFVDPQKPTSKDSRFLFTAQVKGECYIDVLFGWVVVAGVIGLYQFISKNIEPFSKVIVEGAIAYGIYPIAIVAGAATIYGYIYLNSLKFRKIPQEEPKIEEQAKAEDSHKPNVFVNCPKCGQLNNATLRTTCYYCSTTLSKGEES